MSKLTGAQIHVLEKMDKGWEIIQYGYRAVTLGEFRLRNPETGATRTVWETTWWRLLKDGWIMEDAAYPKLGKRYIRTEKVVP